MYIIFFNLCPIWAVSISHTCHADTDHRRRQPSAWSPLPLFNLATTAARQSGAGIARQSCGYPTGLSRQSDRRHKTVRRDRAAAARQSSTGIARLSIGCPARLSRQSGGLCEIVQRDRRRRQRRTVRPCRARRRQPSQHKPARHGQGYAPWPTNTVCHPSRSPTTARKSHCR
jgi:hypothetical protein